MGRCSGDLYEKVAGRPELFRLQWEASAARVGAPPCPSALTLRLTAAERRKLLDVHFRCGGVSPNNTAWFRSLCADVLGLYVVAPDEALQELLRANARGAALIDGAGLVDAAETLKRCAWGDEALHEQGEGVDAAGRPDRASGIIGGASAASDISLTAQEILDGKLALGEDIGASAAATTAPSLLADPVESTSREMFAALGGCPHAPGSTVPMFKVRRLVEVMLSEEEPPGVVKHILDRLSRLYSRMTLGEFSMEVVSPLRSLCTGRALMLSSTVARPRGCLTPARRPSSGCEDATTGRRPARVGTPSPQHPDILHSLCMHAAPRNPRTAADIKARLRLCGDGAQVRRRVHHRVMEAPEAYLMLRCTLVPSGMVHLTPLDARRLRNFVVLMERRMLLLLRRPSVVMQRVLRAVAAAAQLCVDHDMRCERCRWAQQAASLPIPPRRTQSDLRVENFRRSLLVPAPSVRLRATDRDLQAACAEARRAAAAVAAAANAAANAPAPRHRPTPPKGSCHRYRREAAHPIVNENLLVLNVFRRGKPSAPM